MPKKVAKLMIGCGPHYVFSRKRKPKKPKDDRRLELLGGKLDPGETPRDALLRELEEEELGGVAARAVHLQNPRPQEIIVRKQPHYIYHVELTSAERERMRPSEEESRGFVNLDRATIDDAKRLSERLDDFTSKTQDIFEALGWV